MRVSLIHKSHYAYDQPVVLSPHLFRLHPAPHTRCEILNYTLNIHPEQNFIRWQQDPASNHIARVVFPKPVNELDITVALQANINPINPFDFFVDEEAVNYPFSYTTPLLEQLAPYLAKEFEGDMFEKWLGNHSENLQRTVDFLIELNQRVFQNIEYAHREETGIQSCQETLERKKGSCRDMAYLLVQMLRHCNIAARFTSGYLVQLHDAKDDSSIKNDSIDLHAWAEAYIPGAGWIGFDTTSGLLTAEGHIPLCSTANPKDAAPIEGTCSPCETVFTVEMSVHRLEEEMDNSAEIVDSQWDKIHSTALALDKKIHALDIRLTSGGEPTFTKLGNRDSQWNTAAMGEEKRTLAENLLDSLKNTFDPGALIHMGQGKLYPGEIYPRWALNCFWRKDGIPLWKNQLFLAKPTSQTLTLDIAKNFLLTLISQLNLKENSILEAFEDPLDMLQQEHRKTAYVELNKKYDTYHILEEFSNALDNRVKIPVGYVLPLHWDFKENAWHSPLWTFERPRLYLIHGDTPLGYRLPLDTLIKHRPNHIDSYPERSPLSLEKPLPVWEKLHGLSSVKHSEEQSLPAPWECTALCLSVRDNRLYVFMPPLPYAEFYLSLLHAIEVTAEALKIPIFIEGYSPPQDPRIEKFSLTPDPGVIEVNMAPEENWTGLSTSLQRIYAEAKKLGLSAEKYLYNGRKVGSGGGNHIVLGGKTPEDSPFLRRPDVLRSLITFFQHHPSLSYLFSGLFIGPTSQAPRIDEGRNDLLHELEIAFDALPAGDAQHSYWLVDRLLRNVLVDMTGNSHRTEICIDKLFSPDTLQGRLGLVEFRAFEMPSEPSLNCLQHLLLRALVLAFWQHPYHERLIRWGTTLHDKFMLPYYIWRDFEDVIYYLKQQNISLEPKWYRPFLENRFPKVGEISIDDISIQLRLAAEPWLILGEEVHSGATSRPVDSATERLQIEVDGGLHGHYSVTCNGYEIPLHATGKSQHYVAGIRFKAWDLTQTLHPNIPINTPLVFDLVDLQQKRSLGGCCYYGRDPSGKMYDFPPTIEREAKVRFQQLFSPRGFSTDEIEPPHKLVDEEFPLTLDLRRQF